MSSPIEMVDYESPFPECRILSGWDVAGMIRFDMREKRAALLAKQINDGLEEHPSDEHYHFLIIMDRRSYEEVADGVDHLVAIAGRGQVGSKQVVIDPDPEISVSVLFNESQLHDLEEGTKAGLREGGPAHPYAIEVSCSKNGAEMLVQQLVAALKGAEEPLDHVDVEDVDDGGDR